MNLPDLAVLACIFYTCFDIVVHTTSAMFWFDVWKKKRSQKCKHCGWEYEI